jgi:outer membrane protein TolC
VYNDPLEQQMVNVTLNVPILDWGRNKSYTKTAQANKETLKIQIEITKKTHEVAQERYMVAQNRYLVGNIDITNLNIALNEKDAAKRSYIDALKNFWLAYYELRRTTLYDFMAQQPL